MFVYSTLTQKKEQFVPVKEGHVGMYVCGPTVYDFGHLGHGRSAVSFDVIRKYLIFKGYSVTFVTNYTDIDDKMIQRAELLKITVPQLAEKIIPEYERDYGALGVMRGDVQPKATDHIYEMIQIISALERNHQTYLIDGDGVYFDVTTFESYGKLSKQRLDELKSGARVAVKESKRNPQDFVLWKFSKPGEPYWDSPWGDGRPGWHIECSAMSSKYLGETFDIHGGGADLTFPHHECEIAQSESFTGKTFSKYWLHNGFIQINNEKMSKSLGNFFTLRDIFTQFDPQVVRYLFLQTHYRSPIEFSDALLEQSKNSLERVHDFYRRLVAYEPKSHDNNGTKIDELLSKTQQMFVDAMDNDFETPVALASCFELIKEVNKLLDQDILSLIDKEKLVTFLERIDSVLGIFIPTSTQSIDAELEVLIAEREEARKSKNWKRADEIRDELLAKGVKLEDSSSGTTWKKI